MKGSRSIRRGTESSGLRTRAEGAACSCIEVLEESIVPLLRPYPSQCVDAGGCHIRVSISLAKLVTPPCSTQLVDLPKLLPVALPYKWPILAHAVDFPKISQSFNNTQTSSIWPWPALSLLLSSPSPVDSGSQPWFRAWPLEVFSKPRTVTIIC